MAKQNWWNSTSAADDGALDTDETETDSWLDDFDFGAYQQAGPSTSIGGFWGKYGVADRTDAAKRIAAAQKVVQGFVDTFATGDRPYRVTFDESVGTAGTSFASHSVVVSHKPLFDPTLDDDAANTVLTAMAVHESSHVRYGRGTAAAIDTALVGHISRSAGLRISNILDDVRIERRFVEDYPGYTDVFGPALDYVARSATKDGTPAASKLSPVDRICAATRYGKHVDWTGAETEQDFWVDWANRGSSNDSPEHHVAAVLEALAVLAEQAEQAKPEPSDETEPGEQAEPSEGQAESTESGESEPTSDSAESTASEPSSQPVDASGDLPSCMGDAIDGTAQANGETSGMDSSAAQDLVEKGNALVDLADGTQGEVYWSHGGLATFRSPVANNGSAAAAIRSAFSRSRTGHFSTERDHKSGRLDNRSLNRIASNDYRVFNRRTAPSEGKYLVWLMVDCSGSMSGRAIAQAESVAAAIATASRGLPTLRLDIWGWTTGFRLNATFGAARVWTTGQPIANVGYLSNLEMGGTPDAQVLEWAAKAIKAQCTRGETPVIILASDGQGSLSYNPSIITDARRSGVEVVSVALGSGIRSDAQESMYGPKGFIPWAGSIAATARPLGKLIARVVSGASH